MATVENVNVMTALALGGIFPLCELHNSNVGLENDTGAFQRHQVRALEGENVCLFFLFVFLSELSL